MRLIFCLFLVATMAMPSIVDAGCGGRRRPVRAAIVAVAKIRPIRAMCNRRGCRGGVTVRSRSVQVTRERYSAPVQEVPSNCPSGVCPTSATPDTSVQAIAEARAAYMARYGYKGHPPTSAGNWAKFGRFEGVGWCSDPNGTPPTCTTSGIPIADAIRRTSRGAYRVRIW